MFLFLKKRSMESYTLYFKYYYLQIFCEDEFLKMPCQAEALSIEVIHEQLESLPDWQFTNHALERVYMGKSYLDALKKLNEIAQISEAANHHPDLILSWKKLTIRYWTHTAQAVTSLDFELAQQTEQILINSL
jgi:4a-hydroxytetrahydrobiopterin dehydratase